MSRKQRKARRKVVLSLTPLGPARAALSWLAINRRRGKPRQYAGDWSVCYGTVRFAAQSSSHLHFKSLLLLLELLRKSVKTKFTPAVNSVLSLSLSLSLSPREHTREKNPVRSAQLILGKVRKASVPSLFFLLRTSRSTRGSRTARWTRTAPVFRLWDRERSSGFQRWLAHSCRHRWI